MGISIQEAAERLDISRYALRYYEKEGIIPPVTRDGHGNRCYTDGDMQWLELVCCFRDTGMPLSDIKRIVCLSRAENPEENLPERLAILERHRDIVTDKIEEMQRHLRKIERKIGFYKSQGPNSCE